MQGKRQQGQLNRHLGTGSCRCSSVVVPLCQVQILHNDSSSQDSPAARLSPVMSLWLGLPPYDQQQAECPILSTGQCQQPFCDDMQHTKHAWAIAELWNMPIIESGQGIKSQGLAEQAPAAGLSRTGA